MSAAKATRINRQELPSDGSLSQRRPQPAPAEKAEAICAHEIVKSAWGTFCNWFSSTFHDLETSIERSEGGERMLECRDHRFDSLSTALQPDGVLDIKVAVGYDGRGRTLQVSGPEWLRLHYNAAGWPTLLEIGYEEGKLALRFNSAATSGRTFTGNSWGE